MSQVIVFTNDSGNVSVCFPTGELPIEEVQANATPAGSVIVNYEDLPNDHDFFNAWALNDGVVAVDLSKAKEITKERLRREREPLLTAQDVAFQRALEDGLDTTAIVAEKRRLRDITLLADDATTIEELKALKAE